MQYLLTFLEGLASFISPCLLPMIPLYLSYFAGSDDEEGNTQTKGTTDENIVVTADENIVAMEDVQPKQVKKTQNKRQSYRACAFVCSRFYADVCFLRRTCGTRRRISDQTQNRSQYRRRHNRNHIRTVLCRTFQSSFFKGLKKARKADTVFSAFLFGIVFSVGVGPCTGAFLGSALALASTSGTVVKGVLLLLCYSLGLGIPFVLAALLTDKLKRLFTFIKKHYKVIKIVSGSLLIVMGILLAAGVMDKLGAILA